MTHAIGGSASIVGDYRVHVFTADDTLRIDEAGEIEYLIVGGGGAGGADHGGGGGGGQVLEGTDDFPIGELAVIVGAGGIAGAGRNAFGTNGESSFLGALEALGGGRGGQYDNQPGAVGASGGGGSSYSSGGLGGAADDSGVTGYDGANGDNAGAGGGGGAGAVGQQSEGGAGVASSITGVSIVYGSGGGGADRADGAGGDGAGNGNAYSGGKTAGTANRGGGGGGDTSTQPGSAGGSGIVVIRYLFTPTGRRTIQTEDINLQSKPLKPYENTKTNIEALTGMTGGEVAHATDTGENGYYDSVTNAWVWGGGGGSFDLADAIHTATPDSSFHNDDEFTKSDSQDSWGLKNFTWADIKAALKTYFDTLYATLVHTHAAGDLPTVRELLSATRTYYVRTDGSDSNNGLANTSGGAFLTVQKAINVAAGLDLSIYDVTIQIGNGTYTENLVAKSFAGAGTITLLGDETTLTNVKIAPASGACFLSNAVIGKYILRGLELDPTNATGLQVVNASVVDFKNIRFAAPGSGSYNIVCANNAFVIVTGNYTIAGSANGHVFCSAGGIFNCNSVTVTLTGTPAWTYAGWIADRAGVMVASSVTFSGSATGKRYQCDLNSIMYTNGGGANYFPGNSAGATGTGGQYA